MTLDTDLATLREACEGWPQPNVYDAALDRVEAEITEMRKVIRDEHAAKALIGGGPCVCKFCRP